MVRKSKPKSKRAAPKKKNSAKKPAAPKKKPAKTAQDEIGRVVAFFRIPVVAVIRATRGPLKQGDRVWIKGHTTDLKVTLSSLQIDHEPVTEVKKGKEAGLKVPSRCRIGDRVYRIAG